MPPSFEILQDLSFVQPKLEPDSLWTVDEVAEYLRLNPETIRQMARKSKIPSIKMGRVWRFRKIDIKAWVQQQNKQVFLLE
ncbi:MAG: helix-turn-helix domain-containing protein [Chloroflexota bacterium]